MFEHCENILDQNNSSAYSENIQVESCLVEYFQWEIPTVKSTRKQDQIPNASLHQISWSIALRRLAESVADKLFSLRRLESSSLEDSKKA